MPRALPNRLAVVVPTHRPSGSLLDFVRRISGHFTQVLIVDDGNGEDCRQLFESLAELPGIEIVRHAVPLGRGASIKSGVHHAVLSSPDLIGIVAAGPESDPDDVDRVAERLVSNPQAIVIPAGSSVSSSGPLGIPASFVPVVLRMEANGSEFDLEFRMSARREALPILEEPVRPAPARSNPFLQSTRLPFVLTRFAAVSLLSALLDNLLFYLALRRGGSRLWSLAGARAVSLALQYPLTRTPVFRSNQPHRRLLPRYLVLAFAATVCSYAGIRMLAPSVAPLPAKLLVESCLFLLNFAVQRLFIFTSGATVTPSPAGARKALIPATPIIVAVFLGVLTLELRGFLTANLFAEDVWDPIGVKRFLRYIGMFVAIAFPLLVMVPWTFPVAITALTAVGTAFAIGPLALLSVVFYLISCCAAGSRLLGRKHGDSAEAQVFSTLLGIGVWIFVMTLLARVPVNYPAVWAILLALPVALDWRGVLRRLDRLWKTLRSAELRRYPERAAFAILVFVLLAHWFVALMPETSADGLAMHLAIPMNIAANHALTYQPDRVLWAVMPMGADFSYSIVYLLGGEYAAHLLDYSLLLVLIAVLYFVLRRWICQAVAFWLLALFASTPLVQLVTGSLFVENMLAALIAGMAAALWRFSDTGERRFLYLAAILGGTAMATKFGALAFVALAIPFLAIEAVRHRKSLAPRPVAAGLTTALLLVGFAAPPYFIAYVKTGNPLFPFLYNKILTPLIPRDAGIEDQRFKRPLTWNTPYDLTFRTNLTYEGQNGSFGFQYLALAPLGLAALLVARRRRNAISALVLGLGGAAIIMATQPNARYLYAALPLLSVPFAALLGWAAGQRKLYQAFTACVVICILLNVRFLPSASYYHRDFCLRLPFSRAERDRYRASAAPIREVIDYFDRQHAKSAVLMTSESAIAGLSGVVYENHWHQINTLLRLRQVKTVSEMAQLMQTWNVGYFISPKPEFADDIKPVVLREMLERCTEPVYEQGSEYLARLNPDCRPAKERPAILVQRGFYDDFDPALVYRGDWNNDRTFADPDRHTISYTDIPGASVEIDFEGHALTYAYTKAANRGIASVTIDGVEQGKVDLYAPAAQWQSRTRFCCFGPGRHVAIIRVTGDANPQSKGKFIDLDSFDVE